MLLIYGCFLCRRQDSGSSLPKVEKKASITNSLDNALFKNGGLGNMAPSNMSAKQYYLSKSRYVPGMCSRFISCTESLTWTSSLGMTQKDSKSMKESNLFGNTGPENGAYRSQYNYNQHCKYCGLCPKEILMPWRFSLHPIVWRRLQHATSTSTQRTNRLGCKVSAGKSIKDQRKALGRRTG